MPQRSTVLLGTVGALIRRKSLFFFWFRSCNFFFGVRCVRKKKLKTRRHATDVCFCYAPSTENKVHATYASRKSFGREKKRDLRFFPQATHAFLTWFSCTHTDTHRFVAPQSVAAAPSTRPFLSAPLTTKTVLGSQGGVPPPPLPRRRPCAAPKKQTSPSHAPPCRYCRVQHVTTIPQVWLWVNWHCFSAAECSAQVSWTGRGTEFLLVTIPRKGAQTPCQPRPTPSPANRSGHIFLRRPRRQFSFHRASGPSKLSGGGGGGYLPDPHPPPPQPPLNEVWEGMAQGWSPNRHGPPGSSHGARFSGWRRTRLRGH